MKKRFVTNCLVNENCLYQELRSLSLMRAALQINTEVLRIKSGLYIYICHTYINMCQYLFTTSVEKWKFTLVLQLSCRIWCVLPVLKLRLLCAKPIVCNLWLFIFVHVTPLRWFFDVKVVLLAYLTLTVSLDNDFWLRTWKSFKAIL